RGFGGRGTSGRRRFRLASRICGRYADPAATPSPRRRETTAMTRKLGTASLFLLLLAAPAPAGPDVLDLVPENAVAGLGVRNLVELRKKGDKLIADAEWKAPLRFSDLFDQLYQFLGIHQGLDPNGAAAVVIAHPKDAGREGPFQLGQLQRLIVVAVPFDDLG